MYFQIINLKRFQFLNGKWVKSHKIVKFPIEKFDPANYLADRSCLCGETVDPSNHRHSSHTGRLANDRVRSSSCDLSKTKSGLFYTL